ncbi:hypothetical protein PAXINDRAFT_101010 [Paxillus involutus ATCC 200175]|uniref:F-box domain-containing protein n=1 Tax=Paxillus involutus ATCC 200175 TaxID=664439 RepID=A0A0C9TZ23_PAXIN|nr:hypothetical protein PAXINDRAFT_101010 [Paxillus involutus ATCC 200175]
MLQTRAASKRLHPNVAEKRSSSEEKEDVSDEFEVTPEPPKKRSKGTHAKGKGTSRKSRRRGKLEMLPELNLDVLFHIFTFLRPMDLLNLARTTKAFRRLLMQKSLAFVWAAARRQIELDFPDCPPDLSEPQYANLAFYPHCHNCGRIPELEVWDSLPPCLPLKGRSERVVDVEQHDKLLKEYTKLSVDKMDEFVSQRRKLLTDIDQHATQCEAWIDRVDAARKCELTKAQAAREESIISRLKDIGYETEIDYFGRDSITSGQDAIFKSPKQLTERGIIYVGYSIVHRLTTASPEWQKFRPKLIELMDEMRKERMETEVYPPRRNLLTTLYYDYVENPAPTGAVVDLLPSLDEVAKFVPFDAIIKLPENVKVDNATFKPAFDQLPTLTGEWKARAEAQLASYVNIPANLSAAEASTDGDEQECKSNVERLKLASAVFEVKSGLSRGELLAYPDILAHPVFDNLIPGPMFYSKAMRVWSLYDSHGTRVVALFCEASHVVRLCGLDPQTATVDDMDRRNPRLICRQCNHGSKTLGVYTWKNAIQHIQWHLDRMPFDPMEEEQRWEVLADTLVPMVEALEEPTVFVPRGCTESEVCCALCQRYVGAPRFSLPPGQGDPEECCLVEEADMEEERPPCELEQHLFNVHHIERTPLIEGVHYLHPEPSVTNTVTKVFMIKRGDAVSFKAEKAR